jgi:hypothetical protein
MKKHLVPLLLFCLLVARPAGAAEHRVLFVGNSYSFANGDQGLAGGYEALLKEAGEDVDTELAAKGGWTLAQHFGDAGTPGEKLYDLLGKGEQTWTAVVLQEQSRVPAWHDQLVQDWFDSLNGAQGLDGMIETAGAQTVFLMTWGRREGDNEVIDLFPDFMTMQNALTAGYMKYSELLSTPDRPVLIAPAGLAWQAVWEDAVAQGKDPLDPEGTFWRLYTSDGSHPSQLGSYLATLVVYATITGNDPEQTAWVPSGVNEEEVAYLREVARRVVLGEDEPVPDSTTADVVTPADVQNADGLTTQPESPDLLESAPETVAPRPDEIWVTADKTQGPLDTSPAGNAADPKSDEASDKRSSGCRAGPDPVEPSACLLLLLLSIWALRRTKTQR